MAVESKSLPTKTGVQKPEKPYPGFPLFPHGSGKWGKKINGRTRYFGRWDDPDGALREYMAATAPIKTSSQSLSLADGLNLFLASQKTKVNRKEMSNRSFLEYCSTARHVLRFFPRDRSIDSLGPTAFAEYRAYRESTRNVVSMGNEIQRVRTMIGWLVKSKHVGSIDFGPDFRKPTALQVRRHRRDVGAKTFAAADLRWVIDECGLQLRAIALLGINCGFGPTDCASLRVTDIDLDAAWIAFPRTKTEESRDAWLWPETVAALRSWLSSPCRSGSLLFHNHEGKSLDNSSQPISKQFRQAIGRAGQRTGTYYWLRHTFETVAGGSGDQVAVNRVMGHVDRSMAGVYRHGVQRERIESVCRIVREWLYVVE
jgi:integrase